MVNQKSNPSNVVDQKSSPSNVVDQKSSPSTVVDQKSSPSTVLETSEAGEMAQCLRAVDLSWVPNTHIRQFTITCDSNSRESHTLSWPPWAPTLMCSANMQIPPAHTRTHMHAHIHLHIIKN